MPTRLRLAALPCLILLSVAASAAPRTFQLTILHTNDVHGHLVPFAYTEIGRRKVEHEAMGGAARRAALVHRLRGAINHATCLVDAGDTATRGALATTYLGRADAAAMNAAGYEMATLGNNEFKLRDGVDQHDAAGAQTALAHMVKGSRFPWLCANATTAKGAWLPGVHPFVVKRWHGVRVGFLGLTAPRSARYPQTRGWSITDPIAAAKRWLPMLRSRCDVVIGLTHLGVEMDKQLVASTTGFDAIVGGDSHDFLYKPVVARNARGVSVPIVQTGEFGVNLGRFDLTFRTDASGRWRLAAYESHLIPIDTAPGSPTRDLKEDPAVARALAPYLAPFRIRIAPLPARLAGKTPEERAANTAQLIAEAIRLATLADVGLLASDDGMFGSFRQPAVTRLSIYQTLPYHDNVVIARLTGVELKRVLRAHPSTAVAPATLAIDDTKTYSVAMEDFQATTAHALAASQLTDTGIDIRVAVERHVRAAVANLLGKREQGGRETARHVEH